MFDLQANLRVVLVDPRNPLNIGAAARAVANFGFSQLRLVNPYEVAFREAVSAVGGAGVLKTAEVYDSVAGAVADCALVVGTTAIGNRALQHPLWRLEAASFPIRERAATAPVAILFGSEKFGLSNDDMSHCHWLMRIPTSDQTPSMNLGQAVAVCLYELAREANSEAAQPLLRKPMQSGEAEQVTRMLLEVLDRSGYTNRIIATSTERKVRQFLRRAKFTARDSVLLMGFLRQILWKFRVDGKADSEY